MGATAMVGAWWLDPITGGFIAFVGLKEGREARAGDGCPECASPLALAGHDHKYAGCGCGCGESCECCWRRAGDHS